MGCVAINNMYLPYLVSSKLWANFSSISDKDLNINPNAMHLGGVVWIILLSSIIAFLSTFL